MNQAAADNRSIEQKIHFNLAKDQDLFYLIHFDILALVLIFYLFLYYLMHKYLKSFVDCKMLQMHK